MSRKMSCLRHAEMESLGAGNFQCSGDLSRWMTLITSLILSISKISGNKNFYCEYFKL